MTEPAALSATYSDFKLIKTRSVISLSFEVPIEHADIVHQVLGIPVPGKEIGVGIARLRDKPVMTEAEYISDDIIFKPGAVVKVNKAKGEHGDYAAKLYKSYFMRNEEVCKALGTTDDFKAWIQRQESCISGKQDYTGMETGEMKCEESHVERVFAGSGKAIKADYHSVPLTHAEHQLRHQKGESELLKLADLHYCKESAKEWFETKAMQYREGWVHENLRKLFNAASLADIPPSDIQKWAEEKGLTKYLPKSDLTE